MKWIIFVLCSFFVSLQAASPFEQVMYTFSNESIDVVIPCIEKDLEMLEMAISGIRKYGNRVRRIIVVSPKPLTSSAEWFDEAWFPFSKEQVALEIFHGDEMAARTYLASPNHRIGWIYQQLLKLYAAYAIPNIASNVLVLDADVVFLREIDFLSPENAPYFAVGTENHRPYFEHAARLLPGLHRAHAAHSGIVHHMLLQRPILDDLFFLVSQYHGVEMWKACCRCINRAEIYGSSYSEYEIYFNFAMLRTNQGVIRPLRWENIGDLGSMSRYRRSGYDFVACHAWARPSK